MKTFYLLATRCLIWAVCIFVLWIVENDRHAPFSFQGEHIGTTVMDYEMQIQELLASVPSEA
jgi:hypothetical protein